MNIRKLGSRHLGQAMSYAKQAYWEIQHRIYRFSRMGKWDKLAKTIMQ